MSTQHTDISEKAALLAAETFHFNDPDERLPWSMLPEKERAARIQRAQAALSAALPIVLASRQRPALVSGDVPITERTPHGVWIADGPDPDRVTPRCGGLLVCKACRDYNDLRQHLVEQIITLDEQHQREMKALTASRDSETAELREEYAGFFHPAWPDPLYFQYGDDPRANAARWYAEHVGRQPQIEVRRRVLSDWVTVDAASLRGEQ